MSVFDVDLPPGVAFIRSLGAAGVPVRAYASKWVSPGRFSRHVDESRDCPDLRRTDQFVTWLVGGFASGAIDLVAPTSDPVMFCVAEALDRLGRPGRSAGHPDGERVRTALFKSRFADAMTVFGFPTPPMATPSTVEEAHVAAKEIGYPVVLKPRSHVGVGTERGVVARTPDELARVFRPYRLEPDHEAVVAYDAEVALPLLQRYHELGTVDVVSVTGILDHDGSVLALGHSRKLSQSPRRLGVGTMFEPLGDQPFTDDAVRAVRDVVGSGLFELEALVDRTTKEYWAVDLNPRGFGQMSLDMALGNDLPRLWYGSVTGTALPIASARLRRPRYWHEGVSSYVGFAVRIARGPHRAAIAEHAMERIAASSVGAMFDWRDPLPGVVFGLMHLRHPRALVRPFLTDTEVAENYVGVELSSAPATPA